MGNPASFAGQPLLWRLHASIEGPWNSDRSEADCWPWLGAWRSRFGYGRIREGGYNSRQLVAHRVMLECYRGPIPEGLIARHTCNTPACCNPAHIEPGTPYENYLDQLAAGHPPLAGRKASA